MTDNTSHEMLSAMEAINENAARLIATVTESQWTGKTPCSEWNVRDLVEHMVGTTRFFQASASRSEPPTPVEGDILGDDPAERFRQTAAATLSAWAAPGALEGSVTVPAEMPAIAALGVNLLDTGTHCWDLAQAIDADHGLTDSQVGLIDTWSRQIVSDEIRSGGGFGTNLDDGRAQGLTATLAFLGRRA